MLYRVLNGAQRSSDRIMTSKIFASINHVQSSASSAWTISHNFLSTPQCDVLIEVNGTWTKVLPSAMYPLSSSQYRIEFNTATAGKARLVGEIQYVRPAQLTNISGGLGSIDFNPFAFQVNIAAMTLDPLKKSTNMVLSNGNLTAAVNNNGYENVLTDLSVTTGKYYWEVTIDQLTSPIDLYLGLCAEPSNGSYNVPYNSSTFVPFAALRSSPGNRSVSPGGSTAGSAQPYTLGDVVGIAVDLDADKVWFSINGTWDVSADPATGANPGISNAGFGATPVYPFIGTDNDDGAIQATMAFSASQYAHSIPSGFSDFSAVLPPSVVEIPIYLFGSFIGPGSVDNYVPDEGEGFSPWTGTATLLPDSGGFGGIALTSSTTASTTSGTQTFVGVEDGLQLSFAYSLNDDDGVLEMTGDVGGVKFELTAYGANAGANANKISVNFGNASPSENTFLTDAGTYTAGFVTLAFVPNTGGIVLFNDAPVGGAEDLTLQVGNGFTADIALAAAGTGANFHGLIVEEYGGFQPPAPIEVPFEVLDNFNGSGAFVGHVADVAEYHDAWACSTPSPEATLTGAGTVEFAATLGGYSYNLPVAASGNFIFQPATTGFRAGAVIDSADSHAGFNLQMNIQVYTTTPATQYSIGAKIVWAGEDAGFGTPRVFTMSYGYGNGDGNTVDSNGTLAPWYELTSSAMDITTGTKVHFELEENEQRLYVNDTLVDSASVYLPGLLAASPSRDLNIGTGGFLNPANLVTFSQVFGEEL